MQHIIIFTNKLAINNHLKLQTLPCSVHTYTEHMRIYKYQFFTNTHSLSLSIYLCFTHEHTHAQAHTPTYCTHTHICARNILFTSITEIVGLLW